MKRIWLALLRACFAPGRRRPLVATNIQRIVVIKLCCIGDILFSTPLLRALRENFPRARIAYVTGSWVKEIAAAAPGVDEVLVLDIFGLGFWTRVRRGLAMRKLLRQKQFDAAIVLHRSGLASLLPALAGIPVRIGFDWRGQGFSLTHPVPFVDEVHETDRYLTCLRPLGAAQAGDFLELNVPKGPGEWAENFLDAHQVAKGQPLVAIFPGGGVNPGTVMLTKRWSTRGFREVCRGLQEKLGARFLFVGSTQDAELGDEVLAGAAWDPAPIRAEGRTSLLQLAALLKRCALFIGGDSGPLYIAAAVGTPTVALFGPSDPDLVAPRGKQHRVVRKRLACAPCYTPASVQEGAGTTCRLGSPVCMLEISAEDVLAAAESLLAGKGSVRS